MTVPANQKSGLLINAKRLLTNLSHVTRNDSYWLMLCKAVLCLVNLSLTLSYVLYLVMKKIWNGSFYYVAEGW